MTPQTMTRHLKNLSVEDFNRVVLFYLTERMNYDPSQIDGKGDGGKDFVIRDKSGAEIKKVVQTSIQNSQWFNKGYADAVKAVREWRTPAFLFFTSVDADPIELHKLKLKVESDLNIDCECIGPRQMSSDFFALNLFPQVFQLLRLSDIVQANQIDTERLELLYSFRLNSTEVGDHQNEFYRDICATVLHRNNEATKETLCELVAEFLKIDSSRHSKISSTIDSMLSKGYIEKRGGKLYLSASAQEYIESIATGFSIEQRRVIDAIKTNDIFAAFTDVELLEIASAVARLMVGNEIDDIESTGHGFDQMMLRMEVGNPADDIRSILVKKGIASKSEKDEIVNAIKDFAIGDPFFKKLYSAAWFMIFEGNPKRAAALTFGSSNWRDIHLVVDSNVLIPYLCSLSVEKTGNPFLDHVVYSVDQAKMLGINLYVTHDYIEECAAHIIEALPYLSLEVLAKTLRSSRNGYVSYFYTARLNGKTNLPNLESFLKSIATSSLIQGYEFYTLRDRIIREMQSRLMAKGFKLVDVRDAIPTDIREDFKRAKITLGKPDRPSNVETHDLKIISEMEYKKSHKGENWAILTTATVLIESLHLRGDYSGRPITPSLLSNSINPFLDEERVNINSALLHLASVLDSEEKRSAEIVDKLLDTLRTKLERHELSAKQLELRDQMIERAIKDRHPDSEITRIADDIIAALEI